jgi:hypothetical protein
MKFDFASPSGYSDWATYAGFDRKSGEIESSKLAEGVKPPEDFSQLVNQKLAKTKSTLVGIAPAMAQMSQGNVLQGINTLRGVQPQAAPVMPDIHDYTKGIED